MCLLVVLSRVVPGWPLIVAANRDERLDRPTDPLTVLREHPRTLGGRDRLAGGTWLAVSERGVVAGLTNQPASGGPPARRSRGAIPLMLTAANDAAAAAADFEAAVAPGEFNPCWALAGDRAALRYVDLTDPDAVRAVALAPGLHLLENRPLDAPSAKAERVRARVGDAVAADPDELLALLRDVLADHAVTAPPAGDDARSRLVSAASACCVHADGYGTRSAMLVRVPGQPDRTPEAWASEGPPCTHPLLPASFA